MKGFLRSIFVVSSLVGFTCVFGYGQSYRGDSGTLGVGVKVSTLGAGAETALRVTHRSNVRAGFSMIDYRRGFSKDGVAYNGQSSFKTLEAHYDIFPWAKSFHVSPGVLVYAGDPITTTASVQANQSFTLGGELFQRPNEPGHRQWQNRFPSCRAPGQRGMGQSYFAAGG